MPVNQIAPSGYIYQGQTWGDWVVPSNGNPPSSQMLGSMFLYREAKDLAIMAGALLGEGPSVLRNVPNIGDIHTMVEMLQAIGIGVE